MLSLKYLIGKLAWSHGARNLGEPDAFEIIRLECSYQAEVCAAGEIAEGDIDMFTDLLAELRAHENEIRRVRQGLETRVQTYKIGKIIDPNKVIKNNTSM